MRLCVEMMANAYDDDEFLLDSLRVPHCATAQAGALVTHTTHLQRR
eukprot:SAG11_NODE_2093_length_3834_cov_2.402945_1_plen_45_part_10